MESDCKRENFQGQGHFLDNQRRKDRTKTVVFEKVIRTRKIQKAKTRIVFVWLNSSTRQKRFNSPKQSISELIHFHESAFH